MGRGIVDASGWYVYRLYHPNDTTRPIYVGRTSKIMMRLGGHLNRYPGTLFSVERCMSELHAYRREAELIDKWQPVMNQDGKRGAKRIARPGKSAMITKNSDLGSV